MKLATQRQFTINDSRNKNKYIRHAATSLILQSPYPIEKSDELYLITEQAPIQNILNVFSVSEKLDHEINEVSGKFQEIVTLNVWIDFPLSSETLREQLTKQ